MKQGFTGSAAYGAKAMAQAAKQIVRDESLEIVRDIKQQTVGSENPAQADSSQGENPQSAIDEKKLKVETIKRYQALNDEIQQIVKEKRARQEIEAQQLEEQRLTQENTPPPFVDPTPRQSRRMAGGHGPKSSISQLQKKTEAKMPPSG